MITHPNLMKAAHICGKADKGSDDWRNGLPLCSTHHDAFDAHLLRVHPDTLSIEITPGVSPISIGVIAKTLEPLHKRPHPKALSWRFDQSTKVWATRNKATDV
jgi:predicted restriction endonuclease